jgi:hypothetical protein
VYRDSKGIGPKQAVSLTTPATNPYKKFIQSKMEVSIPYNSMLTDGNVLGESNEGI